VPCRYNSVAREASAFVRLCIHIAGIYLRRTSHKWQPGANDARKQKGQTPCFPCRVLTDILLFVHLVLLCFFFDVAGSHPDNVGEWKNTVVTKDEGVGGI
jgi:hypothetical protein